MRSKTEAELLDGSWWFGPLVTVGGDELPINPQRAVATGAFNRVPVLIGDNRDEGRTFTQDVAFFDSHRYRRLLKDNFGVIGDALLREYPFSGYPSPYNAAYGWGALLTDGGFIGRIGGCSNQDLAQSLSTRTPTFFYQFDDRNAPPLNTDLPGFRWGAGHAMELAYLWPSFDNGVPLAAQFTPAQKQLSNEMVKYWGAFARTGAPDVAHQAPWPAYRSGRLLSLRPGGMSVPISAARYAGEHHCAFWRTFDRSAAQDARFSRLLQASLRRPRSKT